MKINKNASKAVSTITLTAITPRSKKQDDRLAWGIHNAEFVGQSLQASEKGEYRMYHFKVDSKVYVLFAGHVHFENEAAHDGLQIGDEVNLVTCWGRTSTGKSCMFYAVHSA